MTYAEVEGAPALGVLLSRPVWMPGAEMGVNECGVCIGNEAVFTKGPYSRKGLTGMDMLRLALERSRNALEAVGVITGLLERYGQGGNCGYDHDFYYDNSFLCLDANSLYVLETAGKNWAYKRFDSHCISNRLSLGDDADCYSAPCNFAKKYSDPLYSYFSGAAKRRRLTSSAPADSAPDLMAALRLHRHDAPPLTRADVASPCMHAGGLIGDHSTASLVVEISAERILLWATGSSTPCISLFKPWLMGTRPAGPVFAAGDGAGEAYWRRHEAFHRKAIGRALPEAFYSERSAMESGWFAASRSSDGQRLAALTAEAEADEEAFYGYWMNHLPEKQQGSRAFRSYWRKKALPPA
jgi:hypothetical protein